MCCTIRLMATAIGEVEPSHAATRTPSAGRAHRVGPQSKLHIEHETKHTQNPPQIQQTW